MLSHFQLRSKAAIFHFHHMKSRNRGLGDYYILSVACLTLAHTHTVFVGSHGPNSGQRVPKSDRDPTLFLARVGREGCKWKPLLHSS